MKKGKMVFSFLSENRYIPCTYSRSYSRYVFQLSDIKKLPKSGKNIVDAIVREMCIVWMYRLLSDAVIIPVNIKKDYQLTVVM